MDEARARGREREIEGEESRRVEKEVACARAQVSVAAHAADVEGGCVRAWTE